MRKKINLLVAMFFLAISSLTVNSINAQDDPTLDPDKLPCYETITTQVASQVRFCGSCTFVADSTNSWSSSLGEC
jgi:hypothetical protein